MDTLLDPNLAETRVVFGMAEAEFAQRLQWRAAAETFRAIDDTLREAAAHPEVFIDERMLRGDAVELAVRAAAADLAVRLNLAEATVRSHGHIASTLRERMPLLWHSFTEGEVSTQNAREAASLVADLPRECCSTRDWSRRLERRRPHASVRRRTSCASGSIRPRSPSATSPPAGSAA